MIEPKGDVSIKASKSSPSTSELEIAKLYVERGDLKLGAAKLEKASENYLFKKDFDSYLKSLNILLRIYSEMKKDDKINLVKERLQDLVIQEGFSLTSKTYYTLGVCAAYKDQAQSAKEYFEKALEISLKENIREDICYAIYGIAVAYWKMGKYEEALKEIYNLQVFFQLISVHEVELASGILNGFILNRLGKYEQAIEVFWQCYEKIKVQKNFYMYLNLMYAMGANYVDMGDYNLAQVYLGLAKKSIDPENLTRLSEKIDERLSQMGAVGGQQYDLVLDTESNTVREKRKGQVDFKSQFILLDLLKLFMERPGDVYSKEDLVAKVWKQEYDPSIHDNKVYVTIKRLRKLIEPDYDKPKYIFRSKNGYYLNKNTRVRISH